MTPRDSATFVSSLCSQQTSTSAEEVAANALTKSATQSESSRSQETSTVSPSSVARGSTCRKNGLDTCSVSILIYWTYGLVRPISGSVGLVSLGHNVPSACPSALVRFGRWVNTYPMLYDELGPKTLVKHCARSSPWDESPALPSAGFSPWRMSYSRHNNQLRFHGMRNGGTYVEGVVVCSRCERSSGYE